MDKCNGGLCNTLLRQLFPVPSSDLLCSPRRVYSGTMVCSYLSSRWEGIGFRKGEVRCTVTLTVYKCKWVQDREGRDWERLAGKVKFPLAVFGCRLQRNRVSSYLCRGCLGLQMRCNVCLIRIQRHLLDQGKHHFEILAPESSLSCRFQSQTTLRILKPTWIHACLLQTQIWIQRA